MALCSGAQEALLYDSLKQADAQADYAKAAGCARASSFVATALAMALGGPLAAYSTGLTLAATVVSTLVAAAIATLFPEPPQQEFHGSENVVHILRDALLACVARSRLRELILFGSIIGAAHGLIDEYDSGSVFFEQRVQESIESVGRTTLTSVA